MRDKSSYVISNKYPLYVIKINNKPNTSFDGTSLIFSSTIQHFFIVTYCKISLNVLVQY